MALWHFFIPLLPSIFVVNLWLKATLDVENKYYIGFFYLPRLEKGYNDREKLVIPELEWIRRELRMKE